MSAKICEFLLSGKNVSNRGTKMKVRKMKSKKLRPMNERAYPILSTNSFTWFMNRSKGLFFIKSFLFNCIVPQSSFCGKKKVSASILLSLGATFIPGAQATDYKRMAQDLLVDTQQQMQNHEGDINSIIGNSSRAKEKSLALPQIMWT